QTQDVIWFVDLDKHDVDYVSPAFERIFGLSDHEIATMESWRSAVHPDDLADFDSRFGGSLMNTIQCEYRIFRPDGEMRWVHDTRFPLELADEKPRIIAGILRDITTRKETMDALRTAQTEAETRVRELENLYSSAPIGLALMDSDCRILR